MLFYSSRDASKSHSCQENKTKIPIFHQPQAIVFFFVFFFLFLFAVRFVFIDFHLCDSRETIRCGDSTYLFTFTLQSIFYAPYGRAWHKFNRAYTVHTVQCAQSQNSLAVSSRASMIFARILSLNRESARNEPKKTIKNYFSNLNELILVVAVGASDVSVSVRWTEF